MNPGSHNRPLGDDEIARLDELLAAADPDDSMVVEELDGFLAALACCPEPVPQHEWLAPVLGSGAAAVGAPAANGSTQPADAAARAELLKLIERHRTSVIGMLYDGEGLTPVLSFDEDGVARGYAWAIGFVRGMALRPDAWAALDADEELAEALDPVMRLVAEAESRPDDDADREAAADDDVAVGVDDDADEDADDAWEPIADSEREEVLHAMFDGVQDVFDFFREARERNLAPAAPIRRDPGKVGRNDPCSCGSGRKFKACCGAREQ
jgi:uncharacterized protein